MTHPTAIVSPECQLGRDVSVGPYAIVDAGAELGDGCILHAHSIVRGGSILAAGVVVHSFAVIGGAPQDLRFDPATLSGVRIGAGTVLRESVTVNRSTKPGGFTVIGEDCFLMACSHMAHDCRLGNRVVMANNVLLAGHCEVGSGAFLGGSAAVHQFIRIGESVMLGGLAPITLDLPPFTMVAGRNRIAGLNLIGLRRRGCSRETIVELKTLFRRVYAASNPRREAALVLEEGAARSDEAQQFLSFFAGGKRGIARARLDVAEIDDEELA
jgi:UDP-N-acetylglucosamine acyltransferase